MAPVLNEVAGELRKELVQRAEQLAAAQAVAVGELEAWEEWAMLGEPDREAIVAEAQLLAAGPPEVAGDAQLLEVLDATPLSAWQDRISLVASRRDQARQRAARLLEPESVSVDVPKATIKTAEDLQAYLDVLRARVQPHLDADKTVII